MNKPSKKTLLILLPLCAIALGCVMYALVVSKSTTIFPFRIFLKAEPEVAVPEWQVWVSALENQLSTEQFEQFVKTNRQGREFAIALYAKNSMTNHVRLLIQNGADAEDAIEALDFSDMSNEVSLIRWVVNDLARSSTNAETHKMLGP